jgi:hypothetical protein
MIILHCKEKISYGCSFTAWHHYMNDMSINDSHKNKKNEEPIDQKILPVVSSRIPRCEPPKENPVFVDGLCVAFSYPYHPNPSNSMTQWSLAAQKV